MISYAQNREDVVLDAVFQGRQTGFYVDVGAWSPVFESVTKHFYDQGWHGINVEPAGPIFEELRAQRPRDVNLNVGLSDQSGWRTFYEDLDTGRSTFSPAIARQAVGVRFVQREVVVKTLAEVCAEHVHQDIDFLKVDVEGHEAEVLASADWSRWRPAVVVVEATLPGTRIPSHARWEGMLTSAGYLFCRFDGINRFYLRQEDLRLQRALQQ